MTEDPTERSLVALAADIAARRVSCETLMAATLERIERLNPVHNAIVSLRPSAELLSEARDADRALAAGERRGWLHGIPHGVKDLADARGLPTSQGSPLLAGTRPGADSLHVARIRAAGAILVGKTNVPEFGLGSQSYNRVFGTTRNAWDPALTAGGSSGGAAVALATRMLPSADGSDMMGSLRNPAAFNQVVGFRPSQGRVPTVPAEDGFYQQLATNGPMGRCVADTIAALLTMAGPDARAPLTRTDVFPAFEHWRPRPLPGTRIGWLGDLDGYLPMEAGVKALCESGLGRVADAGGRVREARVDFDPARLWEAWLVLRQFGVSRLRPLYDDPRGRAELKPELVWEIEQGLGLDAARVAAAGVDRTRWHAAMRAAFEEHDFLVLPAAQVFPFPAEVHWPVEIAGRSMDTYHRWMEVTIGATLAGLPVVSLPVGRDARGRPMGIQVLGPPGADRSVLEFALAFEALAPFADERAPDVIRAGPC
jgi:amidase